MQFRKHRIADLTLGEILKLRREEKNVSLEQAAVRARIKGVYAQALEDGRKKAVRKTFNYDYETCFSRVKEILQNRGAYIYAQDKAKGMIAIYVSEIDTTAVGVFLKPGGANHTEIEVSSSSTYAKETIAGQIFNALERRAGLAEEKGMADAKKESLFE